MQENERRAIATPIAVVEADATFGEIDELALGVYDFFSSRTTWLSASCWSGVRTPKPKSSVVTRPS